MNLPLDKKRWIIIGAIVVVVGSILLYRYASPSNDLNFITAVVERGLISREVSATGIVRASQDAELSFGRSGTIASVSYVSGQIVPAGTVIARLRTTTLVAQLDEAESSVVAAQAQLNEVIRGATAEDVALAEAKLEKTRTAYVQAHSSLALKMREAFTSVENAIYNNVDQIYSNPRLLPLVNIDQTKGLLSKEEMEAGRRTAELNLSAWRKLLIKDDARLITEDYEAVRGYLLVTVNFLAIVANGLSNFASDGSITNTSLVAWQSDVATARATVNSALASVSDAHDSLAGADNALTVATRERDVTVMSATPESLAVQTAKVSEARARVNKISADLEDSVLRAPFTGVLGKIDVSVGENVAANAVVASLQSKGSLEIEAFIPEVDIALVEPSILSNARVTLDALGSRDEFMARVTSVDRAATSREGVATYKTVLELQADDSRIRPGMSANVDILVAEVEDTLIIPGRAVVRKDGYDYVRVLRGDASIDEVAIALGLRGTFGDVEITDGLIEGLIIIVREK
ncbi:MAG: efflux RND transporter periplasmic adaptor subunit [bacterium]|nr:efflux RND transporter periplasmic adaptor subunit [bacterium]